VPPPLLLDGRGALPLLAKNWVKATEETARYPLPRLCARDPAELKRNYFRMLLYDIADAYFFPFEPH
jgi:hypothetical protein